MTNKIHEVSSLKNFNVLIKNKHSIVLFFKVRCPFYNESIQALKRLADIYPQVVFMKIDLEHHIDIAYLFNIQQTPMFALFEQGNIIKIGYGINSCKQIEIHCKSY